MSEKASRKKPNPVVLALAGVVAVAALGVLGYQYYRLETYGVGIGERVDGPPKVVETDDGRRLLWAGGPRDIEKGQWFDVTGAPIKSDEFQYGIGKDTIPAIEEPRFVPIADIPRLRRFGINNRTDVFGYVHNGEAKAYPIRIMDQHELVNDTVGGKPVTVGW